MKKVCFTLPLAAAHLLLSEAVFARASEAGFADPWVEFEDSNWSDETRIACSVAMARFILEELHRLKSPLPPDDAEIAFALTEAAIVVQQAIDLVERSDKRT